MNYNIVYPSIKIVKRRVKKRVGGKNMDNSIEICSNDMFYLRGRKRLMNLKHINIYASGVYIEPNDYDVAISMGDAIIVDNSKSSLQSQTKVASVCYNLGKYLHDNKDLIHNFAIGYVKYKNNIHIQQVINSRNNYKKENIKIELFQLKGNFKNIDLDYVNSVDYNNNNVIDTKYLKDKKLERLLTKWFSSCGISDKEFLEIQYEPDNEFSKFNHISMEDILYIFDECLSMYNVYNKIKDNSFNGSININIHLEYKQDKKGNLIACKRISDILSLGYLFVISRRDDSYKYLKQCEYCGDFFFGRKDKKYCDEYCKYHHNHE